ncbi:pyocin knob domain-containing protein [Glutamicibacter arilaitensis]|uniref:pyocin knob domain-containing protein n=1 Tax=Glutamicibacter arilaitensis TaxID=256701 RepID=UPI00384D8D5B
MTWSLISNLAGGPGPVGPAGPDWFKGTLTTTSNLDTIANGMWLVPSPAVADALNLPVSSVGFLETAKSGALGIREFTTWGAVGTTQVSRRTSSGWQEWAPKALGPIRLRTATHGTMVWDALPDGWYFNDQAQLQSVWNLPVQVGDIRKGSHPAGYGYAEMKEWAQPNREWINRRTTNGWQGWEPKPGGGGGDGVTIGVLIAQQNMDVLEDGWWEAPNNGVAQSLGFPGNLQGFLLQSGNNRQYTNSKGVFTQTKNTSGVWGVWSQAGVVDGYTPLQPPTGLPWLQEDAPGSSVTFIDQDHHGQGYAINTQNWPGATTAWVLHQYSNARSAMIIDNCRSQPSIQINNTQNSSITPDYKGDGDFFMLGPWDDAGNYSRWFRLTNELEFMNDTRKTPSFNQVWGTGDILEFKLNGVVVAKIKRNGHFVTASPNGALWEILVSDTGVLSTVAA